jgi:phosphatidylinositol-3-phosphatase
MAQTYSLTRVLVAATLPFLLLTTALAGVPSADPVVLVVEENHSYESVIGNRSMPFLNHLAQQYGVAARYYANTHDSLPNYFWMTAGQPLTYNDNSHATFAVDNLARQLLVAGRSWKSYAQGLPYSGYTGFDTGLCVKHHNPLAYFTDVANSSGGA